ncbi:hypothetical protein P8452_23338 [Trifolium repens]|nr:hypothetical protein P8452_23338 [Trifolium repens]
MECCILHSPYVHVSHCTLVSAKPTGGFVLIHQTFRLGCSRNLLRNYGKLGEGRCWKPLGCREDNKHWMRFH